MFARQRDARWALLLAYMLAAVLAHCTHHHGRSIGRCEPHAVAGHDPLIRSSSAQAETSGGAHEDCAACRFLTENQATEAVHFELALPLARRSSPSVPVTRTAGFVSRPSCRAPPVA